MDVTTQPSSQGTPAERIDSSVRPASSAGPAPAAARPPLDYDSPRRRWATRRELCLITVAWAFGSIWLTAVSGTPVTNYANSLQASKFQFGLLAALPFMASLLSLPASWLIEATGQRKRIFLISYYFHRLLWIPIALVPLWFFTRGNPHMGMIVFLVLMFIMHTANAVGGPAWVAWMADIVPDRLRGRYFSRRRQWGIVTAVPTALIVGWLLDRNTAGADAYQVLLWCAVVLIAAAIFGVIDIHLFHYVDDPPRPRQSGRGLLKAMREPLHNRQFLWFGGFVATLMFAVSFMGQFVTLYVMEQLALGGGSGRSVNSLTQLMLIVAPSVAVLFFVRAWGHAADRMGKKPLLAMAALGLVPIGAGWCLLTSGNIWLGYLLSAGGAILWTGVEVANFNLVLEMSETSDQANGNTGGSAYVAVNSVIINIAGMLGGLASGVIAELLRDWHWQPLEGFKVFTFYEVLFALSALLRLAAVVIFLPFIHEPAAKPTHEALKFMTANIYNNIFNAVQQPLKLFRAVRNGGREG